MADTVQTEMILLAGIAEGDGHGLMMPFEAEEVLRLTCAPDRPPGAHRWS